MDFTIPEELEHLKRVVRKFCDKEIAPHAAALDREEMLPYEHFRKLAQVGFFGPAIPEEYGGGGTDLLTSAMISMEIARVCPSTALSIGASLLLCGGAIQYAGTEEQKRKYIPQLSSGEKIGCWAMTEPDAGSDIANLQTFAEEQDDHYVLNGQKTFITNAPYADIFVVYAMTTRGGGHNGMSAFILEKGMEGLSVSKPLDKMGFRGSPTGEIFLEDLEVPKTQLLGTRDGAFYEALNVFNDERALSPALAIGMMERCLELCIEYAKVRVQFGKPIGYKQATSFKIARMYTYIEHLRSMLYRVIWLKENGKDFVKEAAATKLMCGRWAVKVALDAIQIHGGYGYMKEYEVERIMRDAKLLEIGAGTNEIQQLVISRLLLA